MVRSKTAKSQGKVFIIQKTVNIGWCMTSLHCVSSEKYIVCMTIALIVVLTIMRTWILLACARLEDQWGLGNKDDVKGLRENPCVHEFYLLCALLEASVCMSFK